jgi:hypothetical protein
MSLSSFPDLLGTELSTWGGIVFLLVVSGFLFTAWYRVLSKWHTNLVFLLVAAEIGSIAQILATMQLLGWFRILFPVPLVTVNLMIGLLLFLLGRGRRQPPFLPSLELRHIPFWGWCLAALAVIMVARGVFWSWFLPPYQRDDIAYHLPIAGTIAQSGSIQYWPSPRVRIQTFPLNSELFQVWTYEFVGYDKLMESAFLIPILFGGLAVYGICRSLGASRRAAVIGTAVFSFTPLILLQQSNSYNDAWMTALFASGILLLLRGFPGENQPARRLSLLLLGAVVGILVGTKYTGILLAAVLLAFGCIRAWTLRSLPMWMSKRNLAVGLSFLLLAAFFGGYPFARNWLMDGNPLAPAEVQLFGRVIFPGMDTGVLLAEGSEEVLSQGSWQAWLVPLWMDRQTTLFDPNSAGVGPLWFALGLPGILAVFFLNRDPRRLSLVLAVLLFASVAATPAHWRPRYVLPMLIICCLGAAYLYDAAGTWGRRFLSLQTVTSAAVVVWVLLIPLPNRPEKVAELILQRNDQERNAGFLSHHNEFFLWIEDATAYQPATIAYGDNIDIYALFGSDLRNRVVHMKAADKFEWRSLLDSSHVDMVIVAENTPEYEWTREDQDFLDGFSQEGRHIYERR